MITALALALALGPAEEPTAEEPASEVTAETPAEEATAEPVAAEPEVTAEPEPQPEPEPEPEPAPKPKEAGGDEVLNVSAGERYDSAPYYREEDLKAVRARHDVPEREEVPLRTAKWRCLIADPTCAINFEINATAAYARRMKQDRVDDQNKTVGWNSGRAQYDFWLNFPVLAETIGKQRFTRMSLGPKGGVIFSDTGDLFGNLGVAARYWFGTGKWAPNIEFTSALTYKLGSRPTKELAGADPKFQMTRGPVGFTADVGFGLGGFGAIVVGGQYDSPLAREDVPEQFRVLAGGMFFVGFRGNILWGGPAAAAVVTHGLTQRYVEQP